VYRIKPHLDVISGRGGGTLFGGWGAGGGEFPLYFNVRSDLSDRGSRC
jgi:hypothetical protein